MLIDFDIRASSEQLLHEQGQEYVNQRGRLIKYHIQCLASFSKGTAGESTGLWNTYIIIWWNAHRPSKRCSLPFGFVVFL